MGGSTFPWSLGTQKQSIRNTRKNVRKGNV